MQRTAELEFKSVIDHRGELGVFESMDNIPFAIKRVYYIKGMTREVSRGFHAHKKLCQVIICIQGDCRILCDDGVTRKETLLSSGGKGIYIDSKVWRELYDFSDDCILLVMASEGYDESDYIYSYEKFLLEIQ